VLSGGQAAGGHNVIMGIFDMAKQIHPDSKVIGFIKGPIGIMNNKYIEITQEYMHLYRNMGGFDMICSGRDKIQKPEQFVASLKTVTDLKLDGLIVIGGDDSNTNACLLAENFKANGSTCAVVGCPKTIDGDLKNEHIEVSFGFDTATKTFSEQIGNLCIDTMSFKGYYYFVKLMGRSASHIALECQLQTRANYTLIGEEVEAKKMTLDDITNHLCDIIVKRSQMGKDYGVFLIPEGIIEFIPEVNMLIQQINELLAEKTLTVDEARKLVCSSVTPEAKKVFDYIPDQISQQLLLDRDPHGNVQVSKIETEKLFILLIKIELSKREKAGQYNGNFVPNAHFFGYEGRCALPSNFDSQYCYSLGKNASVLVQQKLSGYMSCVRGVSSNHPSEWVAAATPLPTMMGLERRHGEDKPVITKALTKLDGPCFKAYERVRDDWAIYDAYQNVGPIQFEGPETDFIPYLVKAPDLEQLIKDTEAIKKAEIEGKSSSFMPNVPGAMSQLSKMRVKDPISVPDIVNSSDFTVHATKKYHASNCLNEEKIEEQLPLVRQEDSSTYFVEVIKRENYPKLHLIDEGILKFEEKLQKFNPNA
jgi:diphosphate--fructose-6-phosphate 1-phosphotransferase